MSSSLTASACIPFSVNCIALVYCFKCDYNELIKQNINNLYLSQSCKLLCDWFLSVALRFLRTKFFLPYYSSIPPLISTDLLVFMIPFYFHLASKTIANSNDMLYIFFLFSIGLVSQTLFGNQSSLIFVRYTHHLS